MFHTSWFCNIIYGQYVTKYFMVYFTFCKFEGISLKVSMIMKQLVGARSGGGRTGRLKIYLFGCKEKREKEEKVFLFEIPKGILMKDGESLAVGPSLDKNSPGGILCMSLRFDSCTDIYKWLQINSKFVSNLYLQLSLNEIIKQSEIEVAKMKVPVPQ